MHNNDLYCVKKRKIYYYQCMYNRYKNEIEIVLHYTVFTTTWKLLWYKIT